MTTKGLILTIIYYFNLAHARPQYQESLTSFWNSARPGELLRSLDAITSQTPHLTQPVHVEGGTGKALLQRRIDEGSAESLEENTPYDYDKAYEEFVKKYFDDSVTDALNDSGDNTESADNEQHEAETYSGEEVESESESDDPVSEASKKLAKTEKCKKVVRGQQNCLICKNPRNGENSESCSYNKEIKPQTYEFENQKNFRKYRATPKSSENQDSTEHVSSAKTSASLKKPIKLTLNKSDDANDNSTCTMEKIKNKICYYCETSKGEKMTKCYAEETPNEQTKNNKKKLQSSHQRIYKRTLSYTYENNPLAHGAINNTNVLENPLIQSLLKEINER